MEALLLDMHASKLTCHVDLPFQGDVVHSVFMHAWRLLYMQASAKAETQTHL